MRHLALLIAMVALTVPAGWSLAAVTIDPNTPAAKSTAPEEALPADERLLQKVTYFSGSKRLHVVLEELSAQTGVAIRCGKNKDDWRVRDIPVIVCVRDMPLGKLLRAIADATHLAFGANNVEGVRSYRIYRDFARQQQLDDYMAERKSYNLRRAAVDWDTWAAIGALSDSDLKAAAKAYAKYNPQGSFACVEAFGRLLNALGPEAKQQVMSGGKLALSVKDQPRAVADGITFLYRETLRMQQERRIAATGVPAEQMSVEPEDLEKLHMIIKLTGGDYASLTGVLVCPRFYGPPDSCYGAGSLRTFIKGAPEWPRPPREPKSTLPKEFQQLSSHQASQNPEINVDMDIVEWKGKDKPGFADDVKRVSDSFGYSIVCEDFASHKSVVYGNPDRLTQKKASLYLALTKLAESTATRWYLNPGDKVIVGSNHAWYDRHVSLVPQSLIDSLRQTMNTRGIELDDYLPVVWLTSGQRDDWIQTDVDLRQLGSVPSAATIPVWRFYGSLSPQDKALAKSEDGLPFSKFDPAYVNDLFARWASAIDEDDYVEYFNTADVQRPNRERVPKDPEAIAGLSLRLIKRATQTSFTKFSAQGWRSNEFDPRGIERHIYSIMVEGDGTTLRVDGPYFEFPLFSQKREAELMQAAKNRENPK